MRYILFAAGVMLLGSTNFAQAADTSPSEKCFPAEQVTKMFKKIDSLKASRRDSVDTMVQAFFVNVDARTEPMTFSIKDGDQRDDFIVKEDGTIVDFYRKTRSLDEDAEFCGTTRADGKIGFGMGTDVQFKNTSGTHTMAEIIDGVRDGKSHYKKTVPGPMAMFVPKMTHVMLTYDDLDTVPNVTAMAAGAAQPVSMEMFGKAHVIDLETLKTMGADTLVIGGGSYTLSPVPSIKKMKSLGFGPDEDDGDDDDDG